MKEILETNEKVLKLPIIENNMRPVIRIKVCGILCNALYDTGATRAVITDKKTFEQINPKILVDRTTNISGFGKHSEEANLYNLEKIELDKITISNITTAYIEKDFKFDIILPMYIFYEMQPIIDMKNRILKLYYYNTHYNYYINVRNYGQLVCGNSLQYLVDNILYNDDYNSYYKEIEIYNSKCMPSNYININEYNSIEEAYLDNKNLIERMKEYD